MTQALVPKSQSICVLPWLCTSGDFVPGVLKAGVITAINTTSHQIQFGLTIDSQPGFRRWQGTLLV
jgi:hypothetical protein